jgi:hypothetical protein
MVQKRLHTHNSRLRPRQQSMRMHAAGHSECTTAPSSSRCETNVTKLCTELSTPLSTPSHLSSCTSIAFLGTTTLIVSSNPHRTAAAISSVTCLYNSQTWMELILLQQCPSPVQPHFDGLVGHQHPEQVQRQVAVLRAIYDGLQGLSQGAHTGF